MQPDVGVCSIRYDERIPVLLLRQQRGYATQPAPGLWKWTTAGSAKSRIETRRGFRIRGKRLCSAWSDVAAPTSIISETTGDYPARSVAVGCEQYRRQRCPQVIVCMTGAGLRRLLATTAMRRVSRSGRSPGGWDGPRPPSRRTCTTRLMLTKGPAGNGRPSQAVASSGVTRPPRHHEETSFPDGRFSALGWLSSTAGRLGVLMLDRVRERRRAAQLARHYRDQEGLSIAEIARRLGRAEATIKAYL